MNSSRRARIVVLASGSGSNFQALIDATRQGLLAVDMVGLITDRSDAFAIERASASAIPFCVLTRANGEARADYDTRLADAVAVWEPDLIVLAGWMRLLTMAFLGRFPRRVINLHPALPGEFPGTHAIDRALEDSQRSGLRRTGVMVHYVPDEGVDDGPLIASREVEILDGDTIESLAERVHVTEHLLLVEAVAQLAATIR